MDRHIHLFFGIVPKGPKIKGVVMVFIDDMQVVSCEPKTCRVEDGPFVKDIIPLPRKLYFRSCIPPSIFLPYPNWRHFIKNYMSQTRSGIPLDAYRIPHPDDGFKASTSAT